MSTALRADAPSVLAVCLLILDSAGRRMLVCGRSGSIPTFEVAPAFYPEVEELAARVRAVCELDIAILRCLEEGDAEEGKPRLYSAVSYVEGQTPSAGFVWTDLGDPRFCAKDSGSLAEIARMEVSRLSSGPESEAPVPWDSAAGWHQEARDWVEERLPQPQGGQRWQVAQIRCWSISSVFRISSGDRRLYFKASPRYFGSEVVVTQDVSNSFPEVSPEILAADAERGWMLMRDLGSLTLAKTSGAARWRDAMKTIAHVQHGYVNRTDELERMGVERRSIAGIVETLADWIQDPSRAGLRMFQAENESALCRLAPCLGRIESMAQRLGALGIPHTLEHGDLDSTNIFIRNGAPVLMDWSDACISHPFFTPLTPAQARRHPDLVDVYLREWSSYGSMESLRSGFMAAKPLAALESAFHYQRNIVPYLPYPYPDFRTLERYIPALLEMAADAIEQ